MNHLASSPQTKKTFAPIFASFLPSENHFAILAQNHTGVYPRHCKLFPQDTFETKKRKSGSVATCIRNEFDPKTNE